MSEHHRKKLCISNPSLDDLTKESYGEYLTLLFNRLKDFQLAARNNFINAKKRLKYYYDRKINLKNFQG